MSNKIKNREELKNKQIRINVTQNQAILFKKYCYKNEKSMSEILQDYIKECIKVV